MYDAAVAVVEHAESAVVAVQMWLTMDEAPLQVPVERITNVMHSVVERSRRSTA